MMIGITKKGRLLILTCFMVLAGAVNLLAQTGTCDEKCNWDGASDLKECEDGDLSVTCRYEDGHFLLSFGGSC